MTKQVDYVICYGADDSEVTIALNRLTEQVRSMQKEGWQVTGGLTSTHGRQISYQQAMVKYADE